MALFNFNIGTNNDSNDRVVKSEVVIQVNEEIVTVPASIAEGKTVEELFDLYADQLGDTDRIARFISTGRVVEGSSPVTLGAVYRGAISSEAKG